MDNDFVVIIGGASTLSIFVELPSLGSSTGLCDNSKPDARLTIGDFDWVRFNEDIGQTDLQQREGKQNIKIDSFLQLIRILNFSFSSRF